MSEAALLRSVQLDEARALLRYAARRLSPIERHAVTAIGFGGTQAAAGREYGVTRGGAWMAQRRAMDKMRRELERLGVNCSAQVVS